MMQSFINAVTRKMVMTFAVVSILAAAFLASADRAQALGISVGTPTIVNGVSVDAAASALNGDRVHVVYTTVSATTYSLMYASNTLAGSYAITQISSGAIANKPRFLTLAIDPSDGSPHVFYYDASSTTINHLVGPTPDATMGYVLGLGKVVTTGISADVNGGVMLAYSSQTPAGTYNLVVASQTFASADSFSTFITVVGTAGVTGGGNVSGGSFAPFTNNSLLIRGVVYFDNTASALKIVYLTNAGALIETTRETIDTGSSISGIVVADANDTTRIAYSDSSLGLKLAVQRRKISQQAWYIQRIDTSATGPSIVASQTALANGAVNLSYIKNSTLYLAKGQGGVFFDDFQESINNAQRGLVNTGASATWAALRQNLSTSGKVRGNFANGSEIAAINWGSITGTVNTSFAAAVPSVQIRSNVSLGGTGVIADFNPATSGETRGGLTSAAGAYTIDVASGATTSLSASSSSWAFYWTVDHTSATISTTAVATFVDGITANFIAVSSPVINVVTPSSGSVVGNYTTAISQNAQWDSITSSNSASILVNGFAAGMNVRLVPQSAQGTAASVNTSTQSTESGAIAIAGAPASAATFTNVTSSMVWSRFSSTETSNLPKYYTMVVATRTPAGQLMMATKTDAFQLNALSIQTATGTQVMTMPALTVDTSSGQINSSYHSTFIVRASTPFINTYSAALLGQGSVPSNVYLTSVSATGVGVSSFSGDIPLFVHGLSADAIGGGSQFFYATGSIVGLTAGTYYVRIASQPASTVNGTKWQTATSPAITISTPSITSVRQQYTIGDGAVLDSSGSYTVLLEGRGFVAGSSVTVSSSPNLVGNLPVPHAFTSNFSVVSSTAASFTLTFPNQVFSQNSFYVYVTTGYLNSLATPGTVDRFGVANTTVVARSNSTSITLATASITAIDLSTSIANTRTYTINIFGRGLRAGSTVQFQAADGSTATIPVVTVENVAGAGTAGLSKVSALVDFRAAAFGGKSFNLFMSSGIAQTDGTNSTGTIFKAGILTVSSISVTSFVYPSTSTTSFGFGVYNSSANPTLGIRGVGLVAGASIQIATVYGSSIAKISTVDTNGLYGLFHSTNFFNVTAGSYQVGIGTEIGAGPTSYPNFFSTTTANINVVDSLISSITVLDNMNYATLRVSSFVVTGTGLMDGATVQLVGRTDTGAARIAGGHISLAFTTATIHTIARSTATAIFDLRAATMSGTSAVYDLVVTHPHLGAGAARISTATVSINNNPVLTGATPTSGRNNAATPVRIYGYGLSAGATVLATLSGTPESTLGDSSTAVSTQTAFWADNSNTVVTVLASSGTTADISFPAGKLPGTWSLQITTSLAAGSYGETGTALVNGTLAGPVSHASAGTATFEVLESSAPNAPTGLTVVTGNQVGSVTLSWVTPGDDGSSFAFGSTDGFVVYYSTGEDIRGQGCAPCYPVHALDIGASDLNTFTTNYTFANTWAQFLPGGYANSGISSSTSALTNAAGYVTSTSTTKGLVVTTVTLPLSSVLVNGAAASSAAPGSTITATLSISAGSKDATVWFVVRAFDEAGNFSPTNVVYSTVSTKILATSGVSTTIDPNATTTLSDVSLGGGVTSGGTIPPGAVESGETLTRTADTNPPAASGATVVGPAVDIVLGSGKTEFKKAITLVFTLSGAALAQVQNVDPNLVKVAFFNGSRWVPIADSTIENGVVTARVAHLTKFAVVILTPAGNLDNVLVYPNPYRPSNAAQAATLVNFDNLPAGSTIKIYTIAGDLVRSFADVDRNGSERWDAKNSDGQEVASGVYIALIDGNGDKKTVKVAVQR